MAKTKLDLILDTVKCGKRARKPAEPPCPAWGVKFSVPGGREVWAAQGGSGTMAAEHAARFASREDADEHVRRMSGPRSSLRARVACIPDSKPYPKYDWSKRR